ncbi:hypothetical protein KC337_g18121 [Hortaea werneckii]|nr:hypothetical protein KC337_g18121 [Hortaea werneckii]
MASSQFDLLRLTATEAARLLDARTTTSVELVKAYLAQIDAHNHSGLKLNALISAAPADLLIATARKLDQERSSGSRRSSLHGIPFVCKDVFVTHPSLGLPTTAGAPCFQTAVARRTSPVIEHLLRMGMILIGKANMTEFCGLKTPDHTTGWSPTGGQTQSPYVFGGLEEGEKVIGHSSPGGSSSGSASAVAAGCCDGVRIAFTELEGWIWPDRACSWPGDTLLQMDNCHAETASKLKSLGSQVTENVNLPTPWAEFEMDGENMFTEISLFEFVNERLPAFINEFNPCEVRSLAEIVAYNEQNRDICMPRGHEGQTDLTNLVGAARDGANQKAMLAEMRRRGKLALDKVLEDHDVIASIADGPLPMYAAAAGCPIACVPLGLVKYSDENKRPYGLSLTAGKGQEGKLLRFMAAFESAFPSRPLPQPLLQWRDTSD